MNNKKTTKRALLSSVLSFVLCMAMLIGTTFAWFTDNATSGVNTIQSGKLDIVLEMKDADGKWVDAQGKTLDFIKADNSDTILWEPGCTYQLPAIRVRNNGNLALKYELVINGVNGDAKLLEAIDFTANGAALKTFTGELLPKDEGTYISEEIVIQGHMKEEAGNEYQDKKIEGISISVFATQLAYEHDSFDNQYDKNAIYADHYATPDTIQELIYKAKAGEIIVLTEGTYGALNISAADGSAKDDLTLVAAGDAVVDFIDLCASSNIVIDGLVFNAAGAQETYTCKYNPALSGYVANITGSKTVKPAHDITIKNCTFTESVASRTTVQYAPIDFEETGRTSGHAYNITVDNCTFACDAVNYIRMNYMAKGNIIITNNIFGGVTNETTHNTINATGNSSDWLISGNTFLNWNAEKAAFGSSHQGNKVTMTITDNAFVNTATAGQIAVLNLKTSYTEETLALTYNNNTANYGLYELATTPVLVDNKDNLYYMTAKGVAKVSTVSDAESLKAALANGDYTILTESIATKADDSNAYGKTGLNIMNGQTFDGNGETLKVTEATGTWDSAINITAGTIKNLTIAQGFRGVFVNHNSSVTGPVILENVIIDGPTYTISCDQGTNSGLTAKGCTLNGWTSYAQTIGDVQFEDCNFGTGAGYAFCRPYAPTVFVDCDFAEGYQIDARAAITFENCTIDGVVLTAENLSTLVTSNIANATVK